MPERREPRSSKPRHKPRNKRQAHILPPFHVILANDAHHTVEFVVDVLRKVLGVPLERAMQLTMEAHSSGRAIIWTGSKEVAELKVEQVTSFHEIRASDGTELGPLSVAIEPAP